MAIELTAFQVFTLIISIAALAISLASARRTNSIVLRLVKAEGYLNSTIAVPASQRFAVWIKNLGLPLDGARVWLQFVSKDGSGTFRIEMQRYAIGHGSTLPFSTVFGKATVGKWELRSEDPWMDASRIPTAASDFYICVEAGGVDVRTFRIGGFRERLAKRWNSLAFRINFWFSKSVITKGGTIRFNSGRFLPVIRTTEFALGNFLRLLHSPVHL